MSNDDGDSTSPDLGGGGTGNGSPDPLVAIASDARRVVAAIEALVESSPRSGEAGRRRYLELLVLLLGDLGDLAHDTRRLALQLNREEGNK